MFRIIMLLALLMLPAISIHARDFSVWWYGDLVDAINGASDGDTISLSANITMADHPPHIDKRISVEGNGHTISGRNRYRIFVVAESGDLTINNLTLTNGKAQDGGPWCVGGEVTGDIVGGAICNSGKLSITTSSFNGNSARNGGAIFNSGEASISRSSFSDNSSVGFYSGGGAIYNHRGEASISGSSFSDNSATYGGAIFNFRGEASISESSFGGNSARYGSALFLSGTATLSHLTLADNWADSSGGGIFVHADQRPSISLRNSILADNIGADCVNEVALVESLNNIIKDGSCLGATGMQVDPMLGDWVEATDTTTGYYPLLAGSEAIDAAADSACTETDQLGNPRPYGATCDVGAIEFGASPPSAEPAPEPAPADDTKTKPDSPAPGSGIQVASYSELANAIRNASDGDTISLTGDITMTDHPPHIDKRITFEGNGHTISGDEQYRIFVVAESGDLTIDNLTLTNGKAEDGGLECVAGKDWSDEVGGAICSLGTLTITNSTFNGNSAEFGGAIFNTGEASISNSSFSGNSADSGWGGAIENRGEASISVSGSSFSGNSAPFGGAILNSGEASISVSVSSFSGNSANENGGAIVNRGEASISGSSFSGNSANENGGAIVNRGEASISGSSFSGNSADFGGAIFNFRGEASISGSSFSGNSANENGGAIVNRGEASISDSSFSGNSANENGGAIVNRGVASVSGNSFSGNSAHKYGGAIFNWSEASISISNSSFSGNSATYGGAIHNRGEASISGSSFSGNSAGLAGGAIENYGEASISGSSFSDNSAGAGTGGAIYNGGEASVSGSSFSGNSATSGGAIFNFRGEASISGSSFSGNSAYNVGGAMALSRMATLSHLTLLGNSADQSGGGIYVYPHSITRVSLRNSILADNSGGDCVNEADLTESLNNIIKDGACLDSSGMQTDPMLGDWIEATDTTTGYFPLLAGSPAIDAAADSACTATDQLGNARPHGDACDIGAIELGAG